MLPQAVSELAVLAVLEVAAAARRRKCLQGMGVSLTDEARATVMSGQAKANSRMVSAMAIQLGDVVKDLFRSATHNSLAAS